MPAAKSDDTLKFLTWFGIGIIVLPPIVNLVKGLLSPLDLAGDILRSPERLATSLNRQFNKDLHDLIWTEFSFYVTHFPYRPDLIEHVNLRQYIKDCEFLTENEKRYLISEWDKNDVAKLGRWAGAAGAIYSTIARILSF